MNIAIIGAGRLGGSLGRKWNTNHNLILGVRDPNSEKNQKLVESGFKIDYVGAAIDNSDVVVLAVPTSEVEILVKKNDSLKGKIIIDVTNPFSSPVPAGFNSTAEAIATWSKSSKVIKTLNQTGSGNISNPKYDSTSLETLICGDDKEAKTQVINLIEDLGLEAVDAGGINNASLLENLGNLWITLAFKQGFGTDFTFKLLRR